MGIDWLVVWVALALYAPLAILRCALERDVGKASATNNGRFRPTKVDMSRVDHPKHWTDYVAELPREHQSHEARMTWLKSRVREDPEAYPAFRFLVQSPVNDDSHWTVQLTEEDRAQALREARREVGLEVCTWERRQTGWTEGRMLVCQTADFKLITGTLEEVMDIRNATIVEHDGVPVAMPVYENIEVWRPVES